MLFHADDEREDHKYVARVKTKNPKNKWRYFYTMEAYKAYLNSKEAKKDKIVSTQFAKDVKKSSVKSSTKDNKKSSSKLKDKIDKGKNILGGLISIITKNQNGKTSDKKSVSETLQKASEKIEKVVKSATSKENVDKGKSAVDKIIKKVDKIDDKLASKGKQAVEKLSKTIDKKVDKAVTEAATKLVTAGKKAVDKIVDSGKDTIGYMIKTDLSTAVKQFTTNLVTGFLGFGTQTYDIYSDEYTKSTTAESESPKSLDDLKHKDSSMTKEEDQAAVNPNFSQLEWEWSMNCTYCTAAYDLRQRGYDVEAGIMAYPDAGETTEEIMSWYEGAELRGCLDVLNDQDVPMDEWTVDNAIKAVEEEMKTYPEGARGHLCVSWTNGGGHDVVWEVQNGEVVIRDCQNNETYKLEDYAGRINYLEYFRCDNLEINENILKTVRNKQ